MRPTEQRGGRQDRWKQAEAAERGRGTDTYYRTLSRRTAPRPAWMDNPALLPKKPPGGRP